MGGILKNALSNEEQVLKEKAANESTSEFRQKVYENTQLNAKLTGKNLASTAHVTGAGGFIPKDTLMMKREEKVKKGELTKEEEERLQWNQENLAANEITKQQFQDIHVDEPKTPYQGAVDPHGEYYNVDDEDNLNDFSLGEPEIQIPEEEAATEETDSKDVRIEQQPDIKFTEQDGGSESEEESEEESAEARHKRFEEMRKKHYNVNDIFHKK